MPLQSSGIIVVEKPNSASTCVSQQQQQHLQQLLHSTNTGNTTVAAATTTQKPVTEIQYYEYYDANDAHQQPQQQSQPLQQQQAHAVVVDHSSSNQVQQQQPLMRRQQQRSSSATNIQQFNLKQQQQQMNQQQHIIQHNTHPHHHQQQQHVVQQQPAQQVIQVSEELYEQAAAAGGNVMISTTGEMLNQQIFKIVTADGTTGNMIIDSMGNVTTTSGTSSGIASATPASNVSGSSKVLLSNLTVLSKPSQVNAVSTTAAGQQQQQQQQQTINFVSTKGLSYSAAVGATVSTTNGKQQKLTPSGGTSFKTSGKQQIMNNTTFIQQPTQQQQQIVQKLTVPRNVQMVARVQTLMPHQQQQQQMILHQSQPQPQKYVVPVTGNNNNSGNNISSAKVGNVLKKSGSMKMSQHKMLNNSNIQQGSSVKTFIQQQQSGNQQQYQQHHTTNKVKSQKIIKQYNNAISNSTGAVTIATLPQQQQQPGLGTYTINHKLNNHSQSSSSTKITKVSNNKYIMQNNQQQQHHIMSTAILPQSTQIHHKSNHLSHSSNIVLQQQQQLLTTSNSSGNSGTIKFVNAHGTVIQQHHQQQPTTTTTSTTQKSRYQQQHQQQFTQQMQFVESPVTVAAEHSNSNIYQLSSQQQQQQQQQSAAASSSQQSLISDEIMFVNGTQMTDEISARILQSMAQKSFNNHQRFQNQQQQQTKSSSSSSSSSSTTMPPPQQIVLQQHHTTPNASSAGVGATSNILLSPKEYPIYNPVQHHQQQQQQQQQQYVQQQHSNYLPTSSTTSSSLSLSTNTRQSHSTPGSRSQSIERKLHETSITKKSSDYFKVNSHNSNLPSTSSTRVANVSAVGGIMSSIDAQSPQSFQLQSQSSKSSTGQVSSSSSLHIAVAGSSGCVVSSSSNEDDIIGEEVRPIPVNTQDLRLRILHAVLQDHTYANAAPTVQIVPVSSQGAINNISNSNNLTVGGLSSSNVQSTVQQQISQTQTQAAIPTQQWSLGGIGATVGQAVAVAQAHGTGPPVVTSLSAAVNVQALITAGGTASSYTLYGQQIPRLQQDDDANSAISTGSRVAVGDIDPGEETETAPEAEDDSVTRCICDLTHDDGYMICCDKCSAWQHVDCMVIDRQNIPDEYLCELCQPRVVDKTRARALQLMKRKEQQTHILLSAQVSAATAGTASGGAANTQLLSNDLYAQQQQRVTATGGNLSLNNVGGDISSVRTATALNATGHIGSNAIINTNHSGNTVKKGKVLKKTKESGANKKTKKSEKLAAAAAAAAGGSITKLTRKETKKNTKRKTKSGDNSNSTAAEKHAANLRQWIENYELAVTNHYSPELRARLHAISKQPNLLQSITNTENKTLKDCGNLETKATTVPHAGGKILISNLDIVPNCPIFELRGKYMLTTQYKTQNSSINMNTPPPSNYLSSFKAHKIPGPFIFFYQLPGAEVITTPTTPIHPLGLDDQLSFSPTTVVASHLKGPEICVDTRTYGNEARFVRRSCRPNAEIQHLFEKGTIHLFIVSLTDIRASTEITIRHEPHDMLAIENKKSSSLVIQPTSTACACGLTKDCLFGPTLQQLPMATVPALPKVSRKSTAAAASITLNGSSAALQLTMGGFGSTPIMGSGGKKKSQSQLNRNRSTSSSGDSNMGLNSPNIALMNLNNSAHINFKNLSMLSVTNGSTVGGTTNNSATASAMHDSGICTSSSSPSVSIPSPSSHIHSPTQQQQQQKVTLQTLPNQTIVQQHTLIVQPHQQQQHQQILAALPTPMLLSPQMQQQLQQQQLPQQQLASVQQQVVMQPTPTTAISPPAPQQQQQGEVENEPQLSATTICMQIPTTQPTTAITLANEPLPSVTPNLPQFTLDSNNKNNNNNSTMPATSPTKVDNAKDVHNISAAIFMQQQNTTESQTQQQISQQKQQNSQIPSPIKSPQKLQHASLVNSVGRKTPAANKQLRTPSVSETEPAGNTANFEEQQSTDSIVDINNHSITSPSTSHSNAKTSTPKEKPKLSREDRKMEAILRAIEKMEKNQQRKQELKQSKGGLSSKRRNSNSNSPASPAKRSSSLNSSSNTDTANTTDGATPTNSASNSFNNNTLQQKKSTGFTSRKKKRKSHKSYNLHTSTQRKRRKSRLNSNESDADAAVTSESETTSMLSPTLQTTATGRGNNVSSTSTSVPVASSSAVRYPNTEQQQHTAPNSAYNNDASIGANVDQAAGLLMAFANPNQQQPSTESSISNSHPNYDMIDGFKSPKRVIGTATDVAMASSPPPTPPAPVSSACLLIEAAVGPLEAVENSVEFKYPCKTKTKKQLMSNWLNQSDVTPTTAVAAAAGTQPIGLDTLVQAAMSDYKVQQQEQLHEDNISSEEIARAAPVENFSMVAKKVEEFLQQTEFSSNQLSNPNSSNALYSNAVLENYHQTPPPPTQSLDLHLSKQLNVSSNVVNAGGAIRNLHLPLQVSTCSNNSSVKKRWLRQAISEETDDHSVTPLSSASTPSLTASPTAHFNAALAQFSTHPIVPNGFTTPLKKRRLIISDNENEEDNCKTEHEENLNSCNSLSCTPPLETANVKLDDTCDKRKFEKATVDTEVVNTIVSGYGVDVIRHGADDESEIVDVGNNEHNLEHHHTECHIVLESTTSDIVIKNENNQVPSLSPEDADKISATEAADIKLEPKTELGGTELAMDQDDDVDILRSPSPGHEKMVAEDNLVKIEPEDTSGGDDVKIDVEREESMAADKFEEYLQEQVIKKELQESNVSNDLQKEKESTTIKLETKEEAGVGSEAFKSLQQDNTEPQQETVKFEIKQNSLEDKLNVQLSLQLKNSFIKAEEPAKKKLKLEQPNSTEQTSLLKSKQQTTVVVSTETKNTIPNLVAATATLQPLPPPAPPEVTLATNVNSSNSSKNTTSALNSSVSTATSSNTNGKIAIADSTCSNVNFSTSRNSLTDDDIQERLLSFHKQNILFLQTRNKKTKSNSTSSNTTSPVTTPLKSEATKLHSNNTKSHSSKKSTHNLNCNSSKKISKKERKRSSSVNKKEKGKSTSSSSVCTSSSTSQTHCSTSSSKKQNVLKKSHSAPNASITSINSNDNMISNIIAAAASTVEKEKNRHRSISTSSTSSNTSVTTKKRQLNFGEELSKDMLMLSSSSSGGSSNKHRKDDKDGNIFFSSKKRRESCSGGSKHKSAFNTNDTRKLNLTTVHQPTAVTTSYNNTSTPIKPSTTICGDSTKTTTVIIGTDACASETTNSSNLPGATTTTMPIISKVVTTTTASATIVTTATLTTTVNTLPYYNTIYGKLSMDTGQNQQQISAIVTPTVATSLHCQSILQPTAPLPVPAPFESSNCNALAPPTPPVSLSASNDVVSTIITHSCSSNSMMLSDYQDTKVKSYNSLGGYVSHTAMFGLNSASAAVSNVSELNTTNSVATPTTTTTITSAAITLDSPTTVTKLSTPSLKILTKTASHDPRLNPILTAPEPPPAPKRKLSINEYRKRKQQSTDNNIASSTPTTEIAPLLTTTTSVLQHPTTSTTTYSPAIINKCTLNSPDHSFEMKDINDKSSSLSSSLSDSFNSSNKSLSYINSGEMPSCLRMSEDDNAKVQFSAAPTLLEKQQEKLCERLKSLKSKQSAVDLVTGRLSAIINTDFGVKKEHELFPNRSSNSTSDLDNCLEEISSSSSSMDSSRESTPERFCDKEKLLNSRNYNHETTNRNKIESNTTSSDTTAKRNLDFV